MGKEKMNKVKKIIKCKDFYACLIGSKIYYLVDSFYFDKDGNQHEIKIGTPGSYVESGYWFHNMSLSDFKKISKEIL